MSARPDKLPARTVLARMSWHIDALAEEVHAIEHAIGEELTGREGQSTVTIIRLQRLDYLRQSLEDLAQLSLCLSASGDEIEAEAAVAKLRLASTRTLLGDPVAADEPPLRKAASGDLDLF